MKAFYPYLYVLILCFLPALAVLSSAQSDSLEGLSRERWEALVSTVDYPPLEEIEQKVEEPKEPVDINKQIQQQEFWAGVFKVLGVILLIALIVWAIASLAAGEPLFMPKRTKIKGGEMGDFSIEALRENLAKAELNDPIKQAEAGENYALAIRLYYLKALQDLMQRKLIRWQKDKTNGQYVRELSPTGLHFPFKNLTHIFDYVEYGEYPVEQSEYRFYKKQFDAFLREVAEWKQKV